MTAKSWKETAAERRDARHTKVPDDPRPTPGKKDTKRWCGGKVGREHKPKCMPYGSRFMSGMDIFKDWRVYACTACGKELERYAPIRFRSDPPQPKPDWVTE